MLYADDVIILRDSIKKCQLCPLYKGALHKVMPRGYYTNTKIVFVGEAPGPEEDKQGTSFVGRSGKLLDKWIGELDIEGEYYITNVVKCFPYQLVDGNKKKIMRPPVESIKTCSKYLDLELLILKPLVIVALGSTAAQYFLKKDKIKVTDYAYRTFKKKDYFLHILLHPSYYLRNHKNANLVPLKKLIKKLKEKELWQ